MPKYHKKKPPNAQEVRFRQPLFAHIGKLGWSPYPATILKAHVSHLALTCEVRASQIYLARWCGVGRTTLARYQSAMREMRLLTKAKAPNGKPKTTFLDRQAVLRLTKHDGKRLSELAHEPGQKVASGNRTDTPPFLYSLKTEGVKKQQGFHKPQLVKALGETDHQEPTASKQVESPEHAGEALQFLKAALQRKGGAHD